MRFAINRAPSDFKQPPATPARYAASRRGWYHPLRDAAYRAGVAGGCLKSEGARLIANRTRTEKQPALNYLFRRCPTFRFGCGQHFVMPEFHVLKSHDLAGGSDLERLGLAGLDQDVIYSAARPLVV